MRGPWALALPFLSLLRTLSMERPAAKRLYRIFPIYLLIGIFRPFLIPNAYRGERLCLQLVTLALVAVEAEHAKISWCVVPALRPRMNVVQVKHDAQDICWRPSTYLASEAVSHQDMIAGGK